MISQKAGIAKAEWDEDEPLRWIMWETTGSGKQASTTQISFNLTPFSTTYGRSLLLALKNLFIARRAKVGLRTISTEYERTCSLLRWADTHFARVCKEQGIPPIFFERIDSNLILGITAIKSEIPANTLTNLKYLYTSNRDNYEIFSRDLHQGEFPTKEHSGRHSKLREQIVAKAMSRSALVQILNITEAAFEDGTLGLGNYAFSRLMLSRAARPETYRLLRCKDLRIDNSGGITSYFLTLTIPKARKGARPKADISVHREVGLLLEKQREDVGARLDYLVRQKNSTLGDDAIGDQYTIGDLPLFPATSTLRHSSRKVVKQNLGMLKNASQFAREYVGPLKLLTDKNITCTAMRHTMATQLAIAGCSAGTIAAVLLHATTQAASVYTDLIFEGAIDELSDSMEDAFLEHYPVFKDFISVRDQVEPAKRIQSESSDRMSRETTGACGRDRICEYAPISCYDCKHFRPAYDVDHTINLDLVNAEIHDAVVGGLQRQTDVKRYRHIANRIRIVINICENKQSENQVQSNKRLYS